MRIVWLITAGSLLLSIANSENDVPIANNVQRVPRALILQPMIKVKEKDDDEGPFDFISDWLSRVINPPKKPALPRQPPMLGPIHVPGLNDHVFIKQMEAMPHRNSHVVIKVMQNGHNNMPMAMPLDMNPYHKQMFPMTSTRQIPMQSGFYPLPSPTPNSNPSWSPITPQSHYPSPYTNNIYDSSNSIRNGYNNHPNHFRNFRNVPGYQNNFIPNQSNQQQVPQQNNNNRYQQQWQPQQYYPQHQSTSQSFYSPYDPRYRPHTGYGGNDFYNTIPGTDGRFSNYGVDSSGSTNYSRHPIHQYAHVTTSIEENRPIKDGEDDERNSNINNSREREEIIKKTKFKNVQLPKADPTSAKISTNPAELIEIYRSDRMVPTNPTYRNRFWTRASKTTNKVSSTTECYNDDLAVELSKKERKYSSRGIEEIRAPNLKAWKESIEDKTEDEQNSDSRMDDEDGIIMEDGTTLGRGESQEHFDEEISRISGSRSNSGNISSSNSSDSISISSISNSSDKSSNREQMELPEPSDNVRSITSRISRNWKPMEPSKRKENTGISNSTKVENTTPKVLEKSSSTIANNSWRHHDTEKLSKRKLPRYKNSQRRVRVVESVRSSVSMTSSRGVKKPKI